ncbi:RidA family protein [Arcobacter sp.]|uniref:RidA family protein n=1 Tax=Arcobacter sp. TaxID=1872629 RepID=UPI003D14B7BF
MSNRKFITEGEGLPKWSNPISHAVVVKDTCYVSGQLSVNENGQYVQGTIEEETIRAFNNIFSALKVAGFKKDEIVYIDIAFSNLSEIEEVNKIYMSLFEEGRRPARTIYEAAALPFGGKVKIVATAVKEL